MAMLVVTLRSIKLVVMFASRSGLSRPNFQGSGRRDGRAQSDRGLRATTLIGLGYTPVRKIPQCLSVKGPRVESCRIGQLSSMNRDDEINKDARYL